MKRASLPVLLLRGMRCGNIGKFWSRAGKEECMGVLVSQPGVQFVYEGRDLHFKVVVIKVFVYVCYQCCVECRVEDL